MSATSTTDARGHFHTLQGAGWSLRSIAAHANVGTADLYRYLDGVDLPHVEHGLLSIEPGTIATRTTPIRTGDPAEPFVSRVGTVRRLRALMRIGWPSREINTRLHAIGIADNRAAENLINQPGRWVTRSRHDAVAAVYRELSQRPGPSQRCRRRAEKAGYPGPAQWQDIDHDEFPEAAADVSLDEDLDEVAVLRLVVGDRRVAHTVAERREAVRQLHARGLHSAAIINIIGRPVSDDLNKLGLKANPDPRQSGLSEHFTGRARHHRSQAVVS